MSRRSWTLAVAGLLVWLSAAWLLADHGVVVTKDGSTYEGDVSEGDKDVTIVTRAGIETVIPRGNVERIDYGDFEKEFRDRMAALGANDVPGRIALARTAFDRRRYDLAREALDDALRIDPNSREATDMLEVVDRTMRLERSRGAPRPPATAPGGAGVTTRPAPPAARIPPGDRRLLTADDINVIRQKELKATDTRVSITFQGDVKKRFTDTHNIPFRDFNRLPPIEQALRILNEGDDDMRRQVRITSDPAALAEYKRAVQPLVLSGCATSTCHGGPGGGALILYAPADSDAVAYTNFYILARYESRTAGQTDRGIFGSSARKLIERGHGENSLLANYGLPTSVAEFDHPQVGGKPIQPVFRNKQDPRYEQVVAWMDQALSPIEPDYGIDFPLPGAPPATGPTTQAAR